MLKKNDQLCAIFYDKIEIFTTLYKKGCGGIFPWEVDTQFKVLYRNKTC